LAYTVDEVSDSLDVPRPTLYRYLREYSIPHLRRSGKIYVPEESFDRIKEVRELHKEGLGTESVRRRLQEESSFDIEELVERLDRISEALERLQVHLTPANGTSSAQTLQTILARQNLLLSAVSNLTSMFEELLHTNGQRGKVAFSDPEEVTQPLSEQLEARSAPIEDEPDIGTSPESVNSPIVPYQRTGKKFGAMARRRRRGALAILLALLISVALVAYDALGDEQGSTGASQEEISTPSQEAAPTDEVTNSPNPAPSNPPAHDEGFPGYARDGYNDSTPEQPIYQMPDTVPEPPPQGWSGPPPQVNGQLNNPVVNAPVLGQ
jgi:DNA-binding transcriptional MerR regulator